jgi:hypothetical protein
MVFAMLLEGLQALTPDRTPVLWAAVRSAKEGTKYFGELRFGLGPQWNQTQNVPSICGCIRRN